MSRVIILNVGRGAAWWNGVRKGVKLLMIVCRCLFVFIVFLDGWGTSRGLSRKVRDCRIVSSHGVSRRVTGFSFYHGLSDFFLHTESRGDHGFYHELSNYRIFYTRSVAEVTGSCHETCPLDTLTIGR